MNNLISKWGTVVILIITVGTIIMMFAQGTHGISNWFGDNYLPKKYMIVEKYPVRIILYGQFEDYNPTDPDDVNGSNNRANNLIQILQQLDKMEYKKGTFSDYNMEIKVNSDFNSRQIRSSDRSIKAGSSQD